MIKIIRKRVFFIQKEVWFSKPVEDKKYSSLHFIGYKNYGRVAGFQRRIGHTLVLDLNQDLGTIFSNMSKTTRYEIRKAQLMNNIRIKIDENQEEYYQLYRQFQKNKKLHIEPQKSLLQNSKLFNCYFGKNLICSVLFYDDFPVARARKINSLSQSNILKKKDISYLGRYTIWFAIKYFKRRHYKIFDFGGASLDPTSPLYGITQYKMSFGGNLVSEYHYTKNSIILEILQKIIKHS